MSFEEMYIKVFSQEEDEAVRHVLQEMGYRWYSGDELSWLSYWNAHAMEGGYVLHTHLDGGVTKGGLRILDSDEMALTAQDVLCQPCEEEALTGLMSLL